MLKALKNIHSLPAGPTDRSESLDFRSSGHVVSHPEEAPPNEYTLRDRFWVYLNIIGEIGDVIWDLYLALWVHLWQGGNLYYCILTLSIVFGSTLAMAAFSFIQYFLRDMSAKSGQPGDYVPTPRGLWALRCIMVPLAMTPVTSEFEYLIYANIRSTVSEEDEKQKYNAEMAAAKLQGSLIRMFEALFETAPQLVFQFYLLMLAKDLPVATGIFGVYTLLLMAWSIQSYDVTHREYAEKNRALLEALPLTLLLFGRFFMVGSRVAVILAAVDLGWKYLLAFFVAHYVLVEIYLCTLTTTEPEGQGPTTRTSEAGFGTRLLLRVEKVMVWLLGRLTYFFADVDINRDINTENLCHKWFVYSVFWVENSGLTGCWFWTRGSEYHVAVGYGLVGAGSAGFIIGAVLMGVYFKVAPTRSSGGTPKLQRTRTRIEMESILRPSAGDKL